MARLFDDASNEGLSVDSAPVTEMPLAMACFFRTNDLSGDQTLMFLGDKDVASSYHVLQLRGTQAGDKVIIETARPDPQYVERNVTTTGASLNTWHHACGMWLLGTVRRVYIDGGSEGSGTAVLIPVDLDRISIGYNGDSSPSDYMSGQIAEAAIWDLTDWGANDAERETAFEKALTSLAKGYSPLFFPLGRIAYWKLIRNLNDETGGFNLTATGTTVSDHPRIIYPSKIWTPSGVAAAPPPPDGQIITIIMSKLIIPSLYLKQGKTKRRDFMKNTFLASLGIK